VNLSTTRHKSFRLVDGHVRVEAHPIDFDVLTAPPFHLAKDNLVDSHSGIDKVQARLVVS